MHHIGGSGSFVRYEMRCFCTEKCDVSILWIDQNAPHRRIELVGPLKHVVFVWKNTMFRVGGIKKVPPRDRSVSVTKCVVFARKNVMFRICGFAPKCTKWGGGAPPTGDRVSLQGCGAWSFCIRGRGGRWSLAATK